MLADDTDDIISRPGSNKNAIKSKCGKLKKKIKKKALKTLQSPK